MSGGYPSVRTANRALVNAKARSRGHAITVYRDWIFSDECDAYAECECGWRSKITSAAYHANEFGNQHLKKVGA